MLPGRVPPAELAATFQALAHPTRVQILTQLREPATLTQLAARFGITRQAVQKHLATLMEVGLVNATGGARVRLRAHRYTANPLVLYAFKENVWDLGGFSPPLRLPPMPTAIAGKAPRPADAHPSGLLLVHGDAPGRWFPLSGSESWTLGRAPECGIEVPNDVFASERHAELRREGAGWTLTDLGSTNGTWIDFSATVPHRPTPVAAGQVLTVGRTHLVLRGG